MVVTAEITVSRVRGGCYKWIATVVVIGAVSYGFFSNRQAIAGLFGDGATSGKVAKLEYRLLSKISV